MSQNAKGIEAVNGKLAVTSASLTSDGTIWYSRFGAVVTLTLAGHKTSSTKRVTAITLPEGLRPYRSVYSAAHPSSGVHTFVGVDGAGVVSVEGTTSHYVSITYVATH